MTNDHEELEFAKAQAKEIWKILDYVRGASPISNYRSLAYSIFFVRYLQSNTGQHFEAGRFDSFNVITLYSYDLINYAVQLGLIHSDVSQFLIDYLKTRSIHLSILMNLLFAMQLEMIYSIKPLQ